MATGDPCIAYVAPEIPALSATFVYEELLGVERRGIRVIPFSVHKPPRAVPAQRSVAERTRVLYSQSASALAVQSLLALPRFGSRVFRSLKWLAADMLSVGPWHGSAWKLAYQFLAAVKLGRAVQESRCTHVHVHFAHVPTQIAMYASALTGVPFTIMAHANDIFERCLLLPQKARRAVKMLTISEHNVRYLRSAGVPDAQLEVVRCGVSFAPRTDIPRFESKSHYRIGTLGRLVEKKGVDDLLRALALLRDAPWEIELSVAGDGPLRAELEVLARQLSIEANVQFAGALEHTAVTAWMHSLDAFVLACKPAPNGDMDGIPVVLMEAMSQRVPVVSTRLSGIPELVVHRRTGLLSEPGDPAGLAEELRSLFADPALRANLSEAAVRHVEAEFGQAVNIDRLLRHVAHAPAGAHPAVSPVSASRP